MHTYCWAKVAEHHRFRSVSCPHQADGRQQQRLEPAATDLLQGVFQLMICQVMLLFGWLVVVLG